MPGGAATEYAGPGAAGPGAGGYEPGAPRLGGLRFTAPAAGADGGTRPVPLPDGGPAGTGPLAAAGPRGPAGPPPAAVLSRLATDPRFGWWAWRVIFSAMAGAAVTLATDWRLGVTAAVAAGVADTLFRARTSAAIPARVRGGSAQRKTRRRLTRLAPSGYLALHGRQLPGSPAVIDHLVAGRAGVFAVTSQRWDRRLPVRATQGGELFHGPYRQEERLRQARWQAGEASQLLTAELGEPVTVRPAMAIYGPQVPWIVVEIAGVDVFCGRRLRRYLRQQAAANRAHRLGERQIELIHAAAARVLPPAR